MQPALTYSWIALTASAPAILLLTCWTLAVFHCRRQQWTSADIFLVAILSQSIFQQFLGFIYSVLVLLNLSSALTGETVCAGMAWFFVSIPIFKGCTIVSLAVDRWLYYTRFSYKLSIRKNHIRYHITCLAVVSSLVGFTGLITFNNPELLIASLASSHSQYSFDQCTFLPFKFDLKFVIFYLSVHCIILLVGVTVLCKSSCHKNRINNNTSQFFPKHSHHQLYYKKRRRNPPMDVTPTLSNTSTASSTISNSSPTGFFSTPGLAAKAVLNNTPPSNKNAFNNHYQLRNQTRIDVNERMINAEDGNCRMPPALGLVILATICTHLPFVLATLLSRLEVLVPIPSFGYGSDSVLSPFNWPVTNILLWLQLFEGLCILLVLLLVDNVVPGWIFNKTKKDQLQNHSYPNFKAETSFDPTSPIHLNNSGGNGNPLGNSAGYSNPAFIPENKPSNNSNFPITNGSLFIGNNSNNPSTSAAQARSTIFPLPSSSPNRVGGPFAHPIYERKALRQPRQPVEYDSIGATFHDDESEYDRKSYHNRYASVASVTTVANDDFEFHQTPPTAAFHRPLPTPNKDYNPSTYKVVAKPQPPPQPPHVKKSLEKACKLRQPQNHLCDDFDSPKHTQSHSRAQSISSQHTTSLSMNDLDLIEDIPDPGRPGPSNSGQAYEQRERIYRKRGRAHQGHSKLYDRKLSCHKSTEELNIQRRVLSMECLSPQFKQTDHKNIVDVSYLDTGEILLRKANSSKCIFVTDFL